MRPSERFQRRLGEHEVTRAIARGGMGAVFEVRNVRTGVSYAAKVILRPGDGAARARFQREAELLARCEHPGIVKVHTIGESGEELYMILDLVRGQDLSTTVERSGPLEARRAAALALEVARALDFVHERGIVHRDVKPSNVLMDEEGHAHLTDFGIATATDLERLTRTGAFVGTVAFVSPEQAGGKTVTPASDVFSLGGVLFHALSGQPPLGEDGVTALAMLVTSSRVRDIRSVAPRVPAPLAAVIARALEKDPARRYPSARAFADDLAAFLEHRPVKAVGRSRAPLVALALLVVAGLVALLSRPGTGARELELALAKTEEARRSSAPEKAALLAAEARLHAGRARDAGVAGAASALAAAVEVEDGIALRKAASAAPEDAVRILEGARSPAARVARARAQLGLGRIDDARRSLEGVPETPASLEAVGDAAMIASDFAAAEAAYTKALPAAPSLLAKRAEAAALAGDVATSSADLRVLLANPRSARDPRLAAPLVKRALAASDPGARTKDLEAALRLGPATAVAREGARALVAAANDEVVAWTSRLQNDATLGPLEVEALHAIYARWKLAVAADPTLPPVGLPALQDEIKTLRTVQSLERMCELARGFLASWPDDPRWLVVLGMAQVNGDPAEKVLGVGSLERAIDGLASGPDSDDVATLAREIAAALHKVLADLPVGHSIDVARLERCAVRTGDDADTWFLVSDCWRRTKKLDRARVALDRALALEAKQGVEPDGFALEVVAQELWDENKRDEAIAFSERMKDRGKAGLRIYVRALSILGKAEEILGVVPVTASDPVVLVQRGYALLVLKRVDEARAVLRRLESLDAPSETTALRHAIGADR